MIDGSSGALLEHLERYLSNGGRTLSKYMFLPMLVNDLSALDSFSVKASHDSSAGVDSIHFVADIEKIVDEVNELLERSRRFDQINMDKYYNEVVAKIESCEKHKSNFAQVCFNEHNIIPKIY